jgi:hypothetical protein
MSDIVLGLFSQFVRLRQSGYGPDEAVRKLDEDIDALTKREADRLMMLLRSWEAKEGRNYKQPRASHDPNDTLYTPPEGLLEIREVRQQHEEEAAQSNDRPRGIRRISQPRSSDAPAAPANGDPANSGGRRGGDTQPINNQRDEVVSYFDDQTMLYLQMRGVRQMLRLHLSNDEIVLGRKSAESVMVPDVDLGVFDGEALGVSRLHATLRRQGDTVVISDMNSLNHTYVNGQPLHPHDVRVLHDGDELRLGQLLMRVHFRRE